MSAGYDFAAGDPVGDLGVDAVIASASLSSLIAEVASTYARGRVAYCLEGGYDIDTLAAAIETTIRTNDNGGSGATADDATIPLRQRSLLDAVQSWRI